MNNKTQVRMDIRTAVNFTEAQISHKIGAFFVDCEFGRVCIDTNPFADTNPVHPCTVVPWKEAPSTAFALSQSEQEADWYCGLDIHNSMISDHLTIIEGFTRCMFMNLGLADVDDSIIDTAVFLFVDNYDTYSINLNMVEREFRKNHLRGTSRKDPAVQAIIREYFQKKISTTSSVSVKARIKLDEYMKVGNPTIFYDTYCREIFGLILFANSEIQEAAARNYKLLLDYSDETNVDKTTTVYREVVSSSNQ